MCKLNLTEFGAKTLTLSRYRLEKNEQQEISVRDFLKFIDRFTCKADPIQPVDVYVSRELFKFLTKITNFHDFFRVFVVKMPTKRKMPS